MARRIWLDLDGVFADLDGRVKEMMGAEFTKVSDPKVWERASATKNFFFDMKMLPGAFLLYQVLRHHGPELRVLTALPLPTGTLLNAAIEKRAWVAKHLSPDLEVHTVIGGENKHLYARPGDILIDDYPRNINMWNDAEGIGVLHKSVPETLVELSKLKVL